MTKKSSTAASDRSGSSAQALTALASYVLELVEQGGLEAQFAGKLARRIRREIDKDRPVEALLPEDLTLVLKLDELDAAVMQSRVNGLIEAMADLRRADAGGEAK